MPEPLLETWQRARRRDRPGLRAHRGGAERALPAARGRARKLGFAGQAVPARRRRAARPETGALLEGAATGELRRARAERLRRLLAQPRGDRGGVRGRVAAHRRRRRARRRGLLPDRGPAQGHGHLGRRERLPGRDRGRPARASGRRRGGRRRRARRALGRGVRRVRRRSRAGATATEEELRDHCRARLARFKVPSTVRFVDALPRSALGKVRRTSCGRRCGRRSR